MVDRLVVAAAAPMTPGITERIIAAEPRIEFLADDSLIAPMRFTADFAGDPAFRRSTDQEHQLEQMLAAADAHYGVAPLPPHRLGAIISESSRLRWVHTMAAGGGAQVAGLGLAEDVLRRVVFTTSAGVHGRALAEFALFGVLAGLKQLPRLQQDQRARYWPEIRRPLGLLQDARVLSLGLGGIGAEVVSLFSSLGAVVSGCSRRRREVPGMANWVEPSALEGAIGDFDAIVVSLPGTERSRAMLDEQMLARLQPGCTLVNVGRGTVIDEPALVRALDAGRVGFAALDVFQSEPLAADSPLWGRPDVLVSPHTAALDPREEGRIADLFAANATLLLEGLPLHNVVDVEHFY